MKRTVLIGAAVALVAAGAAFAAHLELKTDAFNPGHAQVSIASDWVKGAGVPDGKRGEGLLLEISQTVAYPPGASADATVEGAKGLTLKSLGFDRLLGTYCTNGSPRWDVETSNGGVYAVGCASGVHSTTGMPAGWERITFRDSDFQHLSGPAWSGFGTPGAKLDFLQVLSDEGPSASILDNIQVNGTVIGGRHGAGDDEHKDNGNNGNNGNGHDKKHEH